MPTSVITGQASAAGSAFADPMTGAFHLLGTRRFLPLFATQMLGAFNDNLFKNAMVLFVVYRVYNNEQAETWFSAITTGVFILPFFLLSALSGQLADAADKARIIRIVKACEIASCWSARPGCCWPGRACWSPRVGDAADAARLVRDGRPLDLLRPDQICDPAAAS